jgi:hypothetical protein
MLSIWQKGWGILYLASIPFARCQPILLQYWINLDAIPGQYFADIFLPVDLGSATEWFTPSWTWVAGQSTWRYLREQYCGLLISMPSILNKIVYWPRWFPSYSLPHFYSKVYWMKWNCKEPSHERETFFTTWKHLSISIIEYAREREWWFL